MTESSQTSWSDERDDDHAAGVGSRLLGHHGDTEPRGDVGRHRRQVRHLEGDAAAQAGCAIPVVHHLAVAESHRHLDEVVVEQVVETTERWPASACSGASTATKDCRRRTCTCTPARSSRGRPQKATSIRERRTSSTRPVEPRGDVRIESSTPGWARWKAPKIAGSPSDSRLVSMPTRSEPVTRPVARAPALRISCTASRAVRARGSRSAPRPGQRNVAGGADEQGGTDFALEHGDARRDGRLDGRSRSAARVKLSSSATATKYSRCRVSMDSSSIDSIDECD